MSAIRLSVLSLETVLINVIFSFNFQILFFKFMFLNLLFKPSKHNIKRWLLKNKNTPKLYKKKRKWQNIRTLSRQLLVKLHSLSAYKCIQKAIHSTKINHVLFVFSHANHLLLSWFGLSGLTAHNWQKWKRVFLTCPYHEIYKDEAVGLKSCKYTWKITIYVNMWNLGQFRKILIFCQ